MSEDKARYRTTTPINAKYMLTEKGKCMTQLNELMKKHNAELTVKDGYPAVKFSDGHIEPIIGGCFMVETYDSIRKVKMK